MCTYVLFIASMEQVQLDFVEMLRVRDERRRMRHVETLRQQKDGGEDEAEVSKGGGARVELLGDMDEEKESVVKPQPPVKTSSHSPTSSKSRTSISSKKVRRKLLLNFLEENLKKKKHLTDLLNVLELSQDCNSESL